MFTRLALTLICLAFIASPAAAAARTTIELGTVTSGLTATTTAVPHFGDTVTFDVTTQEQRPYVNLQCWQDSTLVYAASAGYFSPYYPGDAGFTLSEPLDSFGFGWTSGGADCTASVWKLGNGSKRLASMTFTVLP